MSGPGPNVVAWSPRLVTQAPPTVELYVTRGEGYVGAGTDAFVATLLRDAQVEVSSIQRWSLEPYRAFYFTSYPEPTEAWEDRWPFAWRLTVELAAPPTLRAEDGKYSSDAFDSTAKSDTPPPPDAHCLVLADFGDLAATETARDLVGKGGRISRAPRHFCQLAIDVGPRDDAFYASGASEAVTVMKQCEDLGGTVHYWDTAERALKKR